MDNQDMQTPQDDLEQLQQERAQLQHELAALRLQKREKELLEHTQKSLQARGLDSGFAAFVHGADEGEISKNIAQFERQFTDSLAQELSRRLPQQNPQDFLTQRPSTPRRGIRKV